MIRKILVANRSEIAIRVFRAANELGMQHGRGLRRGGQAGAAPLQGRRGLPDRQGPHWRLGRSRPICRSPRSSASRKLSGADAIHPGYGLLSESPEFADACAEAGIIFIGPRPETMRHLGNKVAARNLAIAVGVPVMPATEPLPDDLDEVKPQDRGADRLSADAEGVLGRRRPRHARRSATRTTLAARGDRGQARGARPPSARTRSISKS